MKTGRDVSWTEKVNKLVKVKQTSVGRGVFARQGFAAEDVIGEIIGQVMDIEHSSNYCMDLGGEAILEPASPFRFLNHSCEPNCSLMLWKYRKHKGLKIQRLWLSATREIAAGEELTIDYAWPADAAVPCLCGTESCRGWVVDEEEAGRLRRKARRRAAK